MKFILTLLLMGSLSSTTLAAQTEIHSWRQYPTINITEAASLSEVITLSTIWKLDCSLDSEELVGKIVSAAPGINGRTLLLDSQLVQVLIISPEGKIENKIGRPGDGPGDLPGAYRAFQLKDGRLGISGGGQAPTIAFGGIGKIILLNPAGDPAGLWYGAGVPGQMPLSSIRELRCANDHILAASQYSEMNGNMVSFVTELSLLNPPDGSRKVIARRVFEQELTDMNTREADVYEPFAYGRCDISASGQVAYAPVRDRWLVAITDPQGAGLLLERSWQTTPRSKSEMEEVQKFLGAKDQRGILKNQPAVGCIRWRPNGKLWIESPGVDLLPGAFACFDEFDPKTGQQIRQLQIMAPGNPENDVLILMENGQFALLRGYRKSTSTNSDAPTIAEVLLLQLPKGN